MTDQPFTDEDRARLVAYLHGERRPVRPSEWYALERALAHIDRLEGALREIAGDDPPYPDFHFYGRAEDRERAMVALARAALDPATTTEAP